MLSSAARGVFFAATAAVLWGTAGTAQSFISPGGPDALWVGALRLIFSMLFFWPLVAASQKTAAEHDATESRTSLLPVLAGGIAMAVYNFGFFAGVREIGIALGSAVTIGSSPIWAGLLNVLWKKAGLSRRWCFGTSIAVLGGVVMAAARMGDAELSLVGTLSCLTAGFAYAFYAFVAQSAVMSMGSAKASAWIFSTATVIALPVAFFNSGVPSINAGDLLVTAYLGVMVTGIAYLCFSEAIRRIGPATGVALTLLEPVTAFVLASVVAHEPTSLLAFVGLIGILGGLALILRET